MDFKFSTMNCFSFVRFVDGSGYFSAVADALDAAKEEIFITDWWYVSTFSALQLFQKQIESYLIHIFIGEEIIITCLEYATINSSLSIF